MARMPRIQRVVAMFKKRAMIGLYMKRIWRSEGDPDKVCHRKKKTALQGGCFSKWLSS